MDLQPMQPTTTTTTTTSSSTPSSSAPPPPPAAVEPVGSSGGGGGGGGSSTPGKSASFSPASSAALSAVGVWLAQHSLTQYTDALEGEGYDDVEDLASMVLGDQPSFERLVPREGHRRKMRRLLLAADASDASGTPAPSSVSASPDASPPPSAVLADHSPRVGGGGGSAAAAAGSGGGGGGNQPAYLSALATTPPPLQTLDSDGGGTPSPTPVVDAVASAAAAAAATPPPLAESPPTPPQQRQVAAAAATSAAAATPREGKATPVGVPVVPAAAVSPYASPVTGLVHRELGRFKVIVVGDAGTGKTCFIHQLVHAKFNQNTKATIGLDWREKQLPVAGGYVTIQFWDISGQERFANVTRAYYQGAHGAIVCYDTSNPGSIRTVEKWKRDIDSKVFVGGGDDGTVIPCLLVGTKSDLPAARGMTDSETNTLTRTLGFMARVETSARLNLNVREAADTLSLAMLDEGASERANLFARCSPEGVGGGGSPGGVDGVSVSVTATAKLRRSIGGAGSGVGGGRTAAFNINRCSVDAETHAAQRRKKCCN
eukprot:Rhum_TRINITY_DN12862_c0_g1::Rhum_TRINITY_DN12862_c0_g1_i1::g.54977::m.54977/K07918/RAB32; Ras-related protein Rab-32